MPDRLTRIVTRGGDRGETSLGDGARVKKSTPRVALLGDIDELNSWIGVVLAHAPGGEIAETLRGVQHDLFDLGGAVSMPGAPLLAERHLERLDAAASEWNASLPPLKEFILPGGAPVVAFLHVARTVARRAERSAASLFPDGERGCCVPYLNRLSDVLFIAARLEAKRLGADETLWQKVKSPS
jgi:cob(I)alamin adenosyltransferase